MEGLQGQGGSVSLFNLHREKLELFALREEVELSTTMGADDKALTLKAIDDELQKYVEGEVRKVSNIAGLLKHFDAKYKEAVAEELRIHAHVARWANRVAKLKAMVLGVMQAFDVKKLESSTDWFRRHNNPVSLEVTDIGSIEEKFLKATVKMTFEDWQKMVSLAHIGADTLGWGKDRVAEFPRFTVTSEVDNAALKAACAVMVPCAACSGKGGPVDLTIYGGGTNEPCPQCSGAGSLQATVPGARLIQGEHLRVG